MSIKQLSLTAAALLGFKLLLAQDSARVNQLDEVVVTATKSPLKQSQTGKVVTVITKQELQNNNGRTLGQVLNQQAGLVINGAYNTPGTNQTVYMRGAGSGRTLILIDGLPVNDPSLINNEFDINLLSINDIQRVEICRGAQSTLYGSDAVAGVINIITTNNDVSKPLNISSTIAGGNLGTFKGNVQLYGKKDKLTYSLRYSKLNTGGFSSALDTSRKKGFDRDGYDGNITNAQVQYQANDHLLFKTFFQYNQYKADVDASAFKDDKDFTIDNRNVITGAGFQYKRDNITITGNYQYSDIYRDYLDDSSSVGGFSKFSTNNFYGKAQFIELYASTKLGSGFTLLQGADYRSSTMNSQYFSISSFGPYRSGFKDTTMSQASAYASLNYNSASTKLNIELGGRLNVHSRYGTNSTYTFNPSYNISKHFRVFGSMATGFKAPSLFQLYDGSSGNRNLQPEESLNYEIGVQQQHGRFSNRLVFFYRNIKNGIDYNNVTFKYFNFLKQIARGFEWEFNVNPTDFLSIRANYSYLSISERTQNRVLQNKDTTYRYALRRPNHAINASADFLLTPAFTLSVNARYASDQRDVGGYRLPDVLLQDYTLLGGHLAYTANKHVRFFADAQNITGKKFFDARGYNSIPFVFTGGVSVNW
ncbi:MAG TPA: TonB-dependent receptor [Chitinophagaceae bacterium]|nr:TonB-dependent receptor [Chitinophagaceae bacterium]